MIPLSAAQIKQQFQEAMKLLSAGKLDAAEAKFLTVLGSAPNLAEAHFQLGRIAMARREAEHALTHFSQARKLKPSEPAIWQQMAETLAALDDKTRTRAFLAEAKAARLNPTVLIALQNRFSKSGARSKTSIGSARAEDVQRLVGLVKANKLKEAEALGRSLRQQHPKVAMIAHVLANSLLAQGKVPEGAKLLAEAVKLDPNYAEARNDLGGFLMKTGKVAQGLSEVQAALKIAPKMPQALGNLGFGLSLQGDLAGSIAALMKATADGGGSTETHLLLGRQLMNARNYEGAAKALKRAVQQGLSSATVLARLAQAYERVDGEEAALATYAKAEKKDPSLALVFGLRGLFLQKLGQFEEAERDFRRAIELEPDNGEHYRTLVASYKLTADDPLIAEMEVRFADQKQSDHSRMHLGFALSRVMEQIGAHDRVFGYLDPANALMRKLYPYDIATRRAEVDGVKAAFAPVDFSTVKGASGATDYAPIFVTGMPRSGTTLVEQILASHSEVGGGGELGYFAGEVLRHMKAEDGFRAFNEVPEAIFKEIGEGEEERLKALCPDTKRATDKAIQTYMVMGAIKKALPNAKIVLVRRDPRDTLLSIYKNMFAEGTHRYSNNQRDLGLYYRMFEEMVEFWREKLPGGFYEIQYEDLIANPEDEARKLLAACDLTWEDQCLDFHKNTRRVSTLSVAQVRQPIYASSVAAWKRHEDELAEMIEALGDAI
ncbi:tetratricopeptide repeat-containing sulfotransferase family protein [Actibacterium lipolyticum]|uniref:Tetratricopeptide repeat protein n=1 Tax=Actibacterium lipolyticum TaxID=1524263 RepID=A0A238KUR6_9RHOB|nr:tetratricopeptide repeat-containing sulfotransferase family protein [Actibacterium lipolyticum]SMX46341.1 tetratricopeptide repeat protein [Actibacterium lipolyticum]